MVETFNSKLLNTAEWKYPRRPRKKKLVHCNNSSITYKFNSILKLAQFCLWNRYGFTRSTLRNIKDS